jgi:hypothetical protein
MFMAKKYKEIREKITEISPYDFENSIDRVINYLIDIKNSYEEQLYINMSLSWVNGYDGYGTFYLYGIREETDEEYQKRLKFQKEIREKSKKQKEHTRQEIVKQAKKLKIQPEELL